jgi:hypothetical protein
MVNCLWQPFTGTVPHTQTSIYFKSLAIAAEQLLASRRRQI